MSDDTPATADTTDDSVATATPPTLSDADMYTIRVLSVMAFEIEQVIDEHNRAVSAARSRLSSIRVAITALEHT